MANPEIEAFVAAHCSEPADREFFPPVPTKQPTTQALTGSSLILELVPALARIVVELPRGDQRRVHFQPGCPARLMLEKVTGVHILDCITHASQARLIWLTKLARHALEVGDELHQYDGVPCLEFATGFVAGEVAPHDLFAGAEGEARALDAALASHRGPISNPLTDQPFSLGFRTRRDQLRQQRQADLDTI